MDECCEGKHGAATETAPPILLQREGLPADVSADDLVSALADAAAYGGIILRRPLPEDFQVSCQRFADSVPASSPRTGEFASEKLLLPAPDDAVAAAAVATASTLPEGPIRDRVTADAENIAVALNRLVGPVAARTSLLSLCIEIVGEERCQRWHMDQYTGRVVVTYGLQSGTEFVDDAHANRAAVRDWEATNKNIVPDPSKAVAAPPGAIALIKGTRWPGLGDRAVIHRSPDVTPVDDSYLPHRLLLKIDIKAATQLEEPAKDPDAPEEDETELKFFGAAETTH